METITINLAAVVVLLLANGFFVAAEFALVKARGTRIELLAADGRSSAKLTMRIQANLEAYLAACQLGITMASLGLGWVGEPAVATLLEPLFQHFGVPQAMLHSMAFLVGFLLFSALHIVIGEQVPKTFAIRKAEPVSLWVAYPLHVAYLTVFPLNWLLNNTTRSILKLFRVAEATHAEVYSGDELKGLVVTSEQHGELTSARAEMLKNLFEFDQRQVGRVMIPRTMVKLLDVSEEADRNLAAMRDSRHSRFPLVDNTGDKEAILGIVLAKDVYAAMLREDKEPWRDLRPYCRQPLIVPEIQKIARLFDLMRSDKAHMAIVVDEYGELMGIVTLEDLLEEIVGDIEDETDAIMQSNIIKTLSEGRWEVDGLMSLADAQRSIGLVVPQDLEANTLSGLCMSHLGEMPEVGDEFVLLGYRLMVQSVDSHRVGKLLIERINNDAETIENEAAENDG